ncbi:MAG TPA: hypothetical protein PJ982_07130 [Lacipirellulaceae bacterium]|nr:hypothetical protein [Lacipirellulaceae bacterium]
MAYANRRVKSFVTATTVTGVKEVNANVGHSVSTSAVSPKTDWAQGTAAITNGMIV